MKATDDLFMLIKNLSKGEKQFLAKTIKGFSIKESPSHIQLIQILDSLKEYDEKVVLAKLGDKANNFSYLKNYSYNFLLDILVKSNSESSLHTILQNEIHSAEILFEKGLYAQAEKIVKKTKKQVIQSGYLNLMYQILTLEDKISREELHLDQIQIQADKKEELQFAEFTVLVANMRNSFNSLSANIFRNPDQLDDKATNEIANAKRYIEKSKQHDSLEIKRLRFHLQSMIAALNRSISAFSSIRDTIRFYEENQSVLNEHFHDYMMMNTLFFFIFCKTGNTDAVCKQCAHLENIIQTDKLNLTTQVRHKFLQRVNNFLFHHHLDNGEWKLIDNLSKKAMEDFKRYESSLGSLDFMWFCHFNSYYHFSIERFDIAHTWIYKMIQSDFYPDRKISHAVTRIYLLFLHYELKNFDYLSNSLRNESRYVEKLSIEDELEDTIIRHLKQAIDNPNPTNKFKEMKSVLLSKKFSKTLTVTIIDCFNIYAWLDSKIENKPFRECVPRNSFLQPIYKFFMNPKLKEPEFMSI